MGCFDNVKVVRNKHLALAYAQMGIPVFACHPHSGRPTDSRKLVKSATTSPKIIERTWTRFPDSLIATPSSVFTIFKVSMSDAPKGSQLSTVGAIEEIVKRMTDVKFLISESAHGDCYIFFKKTVEIEDLREFLPNISTLDSDTDYGFLPDRAIFRSEYDAPWDVMASLDEVPMDTFSDIVEGFSLTTSLIRSLTTDKLLTEQEKGKKSVRKWTLPPEFDGEVRFTRAAIGTDADGYEADNLSELGYESFLTDGVLKIENGSLTTTKINEMFHNLEIQLILADFLGIRSMNVDYNTSFTEGGGDYISARLNSDHTHVLIRDVNNVFGNSEPSRDYNLVQFYTMTRYGEAKGSLKSPEFVVWFLRLLVDAGLLDVSSNMRQRVKDIPAEYESFDRDIRLLDAVKQLYSNYDGETIVTDAFAAAWCNASVAAANMAKRVLVEGKSLFVVGRKNCNARGGSTPHMTNIYKISGKPVREAAENEKEEIVEMSREKVTLKGVRVSENSYQTIRNFCEDVGIENVPTRDHMFVEVGIMKGWVKDEKDALGRTFYIEDFNLEILPSLHGGRKVLYLVGESEALERVFWDNSSSFEMSDMSDEPMIGIVISNDIGSDVESEDLEKLSNQLEHYTDGLISLDEEFSLRIREEDVFSYMDGIDPVDDE